MIVYKVVEKKTRLCSNLAMFKQVAPFSKKEVKQLVGFYTTNKKTKMFFPIYEKGKTIKAAEKTNGLMCFTTIAAAKRFIKESFNNPEKLEIITVEGIGRPKKNFEIIVCCGSYPAQLFEKSKDLDKVEAIWGTVAFKYIKVLE